VDALQLPKKLSQKIMKTWGNKNIRNPLQIGDTIEVLDTEGIYSSYIDMAKKLEIYNIWYKRGNNIHLKRGDKGKIINFDNKEMIYAILVEPYAYLISWQSVKFVERFYFFTKEEFIL
jgi:hypothetical protein